MPATGFWFLFPVLSARCGGHPARWVLQGSALCSARCSVPAARFAKVRPQQTVLGRTACPAASAARTLRGPRPRGRSPAHALRGPALGPPRPSPCRRGRARAASPHWPGRARGCGRRRGLAAVRGAGGERRRGRAGSERGACGGACSAQRGATERGGRRRRRPARPAERRNRSPATPGEWRNRAAPRPVGARGLREPPGAPPHPLVPGEQGSPLGPEPAGCPSVPASVPAGGGAVLPGWPRVALPLGAVRRERGLPWPALRCPSRGGAAFLHGRPPHELTALGLPGGPAVAALRSAPAGLARTWGLRVPQGGCSCSSRL